MIGRGVLIRKKVKRAGYNYSERDRCFNDKEKAKRPGLIDSERGW